MNVMRLNFQGVLEEISQILFVLQIFTKPDTGIYAIMHFYVNPYPANVDNMAISYQC